MSETEISKIALLKLKIKINIWMCIISASAIFVPLFAIAGIVNNSYEWFLIASGNLLLMPGILFGITWIICIICKFKKNMAIEIKKIYMLMPIYYMFFTFPFCSLVLCIINGCIQ